MQVNLIAPHYMSRQLAPVHGAIAGGVIRLAAREQSGAKKSYRVIGGPHNNAALTLR